MNNAELVIDDVSGFAYDDVYRQRYQLGHFSIPCRKATAAERLEPFSRARRYLKRAYNRRRPLEKRRYIQQEGIDFDPRLLQITPPTTATNVEMAARIRDSLAVAVHVRFFDEPNAVGINNAPGDFYARALEKMETRAPDAHYFVFSDRHDAARARIPLPDERITCVSHNRGHENAYADLWLMTHCRHFIIANSTFSWWGAWLADHAGKHVIAPGFEMRQGKMWWGFEGLLPEEWISL